MRAGAILSRVRQDLHDQEGVRFNTAILLSWLSDAQRSLVLLRPDANAVVERVTLEAGATMQHLPENGVRFLGVLRNVTGNRPGRAVTLTTLDALNAGVPLWHEGDLSDVIFEYAPDENTPTLYYVSPPPEDGVTVEIKYAVDPPELTGEEQELSVFSTFAEPLREYVLYRAFSRNDQAYDYQGRANQHLSLFYSAIGEDQTARLLTSPLNELGDGK